jgi:hypothetical protein
MVVDDLGLAAWDGPLQEAAGFDQALRHRESTRRQGDEAVLRGEKQLRQALGGMSMVRWRRAW